MRRVFGRYDVILAVLALAGLAVFTYTASRLYPETAGSKRLGTDDIRHKAKILIKEMGYEIPQQDLQLRLVSDNEQLRYLYEQFGVERALTLARDSIPIYRWEISWKPQEAGRDTISVSIGQNQSERSVKNILTLDFKGLPLVFNSVRRYSETSQTTTIEKDSSFATLVAQNLFRYDEGKWVFYNAVERGGGDIPVHRFTWSRTGTVAGQTVELSVDIAGGRVVRFQRSYTIPKEYSLPQPENEWYTLILLVFFLILFIIMIVYFVRRLRGDLLELKNGALPAFLTGLAWLGWFWGLIFLEGLSLSSLLIPTLIFTPFIIGGIWMLYSVADSLVREEWSEKLLTIDTIRRRILFPQTGLALLRGILVAFIALGINSLLIYLGTKYAGGYVPIRPVALRFLSLPFSSLFILGESIFISIYLNTALLLFTITLLRRWFKKRIWLVLPLLIILSLTSFPIPQVHPFWLKAIGSLLLGALFIHIFLRFDFLSVLAGSFFLPIIFYGYISFILGGTLLVQGFIILVVVLFITVYALRAYHSETTAEEVSRYVPEYMQRIYERERIQRELEIARHVQLTFLPRENPAIAGLDIATICLPAREVGGDYYDFLIDQDRLGVIIGDVSGKGIPAAFYMTMTKGFLKSQTEFHTSPRDILIHMNKLFYENAERGMFISMIIGIFNLREMTLTFARAGHNPVILHRVSEGLAKEISVPGMALGLDAGLLFNKTIEERTIEYMPGDIFFFYTDGISEAQNGTKDEFGEERLMHFIESNYRLAASELLVKIQIEIENFVTGTPQHDDITAVLVKIE